jgi:NAD(P)-dependent dehydrogenase (short-subunit alcohol dehydrogenase family)
VVLGASVGTGAAIATVLARERALDIFGVHRGNHPEGAEQVARAVRDAGRRAHLWTSDAAGFEAAQAGAQELLDRAGPRSVRFFAHAISSASVGHLAVGHPRLHWKQLHKTFDAMAHSFVYWTQAMVERDLLARGAQLLGFSSPVVDSLIGDCSAIAAAKSALETYVRHLAFELGPLGVRVNLLKFGAVKTAALREVYSGEAWERLRAVHDRITPVGDLCTVEEVAAFVSLLAGDRCRWFNGATIDFTGAAVQSLYHHQMFPETDGGDAFRPQEDDDG